MNWRKTTLGPRINILSGFPFDSDKFSVEGGFPLLRIRDLSNINTEIGYTGTFSNEYVIKQGDLLIGMDGDFHVRLWKGNEALLNQRVCKLKAKNEKDINTKFLYYRLIKEIKKINETVSATTVKHLSTKDIFNLELNLPSNDEQNIIAKILTEADDALEQAQLLIAKYGRIKTGLMQDLLTNGIDVNGNIRNKATHKFIVKNGIEVPDEWEVDGLGCYANIHNNLRRPISSIDRYGKQGQYPYYGATGIIDKISEFRIEGTYVLIGEDGDHFLKFSRASTTILMVRS